MRRTSSVRRTLVGHQLIDEAAHKVVAGVAGNAVLLAFVRQDRRGRALYVRLEGGIDIALNLGASAGILVDGSHLLRFGRRQNAASPLIHFDASGPNRLLLEQYIADLLVLSDLAGGNGVAGRLHRMRVMVNERKF